MHPQTRILHLRLIRLLRGCLMAWETWLREITGENLPSTKGTTNVKNGG